MRAFELFQVIGSGSVQELICQTLQLPTAAEEIKEIRKTVIIDNCRVIYDKVIIDGRLRKDIMFKAANQGFPQPGSVQGCGGIVGTISGPIQDLDVDIAFNALIPVKGACPDDHCVVLDAFVEGEKEEAANILPTGAFTALIDKSVVFLCVKVVRDVVTDFHDDDDHDHRDSSGSGSSGGCSGSDSTGFTGKPKKKKKDPCGDRGRDKLCKKRRSMGVSLRGGDRIPPAKPGQVPGTWIGPTLIFEGVLNPGIPSLQPLANPIVNPTGTLIQVNEGQNAGS